ncbi:hypothetical protein TVAG_353350 [Trichomonas vaginalis G3]|uniref:Uncharacterized protein n=1 Tax=Trichomonas vaginalis (strain ATCC PRA-98 / G3) TaxID=412133 RepID=A2EN58_TRIV3|nr:acid cluster protein 33 family [Trichomonas vaginalis G3]EAY05895.1 hypothetical protein TVAG_353350 [Trichomonas vaginalis G3]KAI5520221.1 acid cluster protein 33 family [Trichomonas vaginalis G3]|eukprot:XP_001318118.1 hypothetical protein [Trichomonas vaginalis G3]
MSKEEYSVSSEEFVNFSVKAPLTTFVDTINNKCWEYRLSIAENSVGTVIILPGIYENTNTSYKLATKLFEDGYRVLILSIPAYDNINELLVGFDTITASLKVFSAHIIGVDFGGFISLFLKNSKFLSCEILSFTLVSSYINSTKYKKNLSFFSQGSKSDLIVELSPKAIPPHLKLALDFVISQLDTVPSDVIKGRIKCRKSHLKAPIPENGDNFLIIQPTDFAYKLDSNDRPNHAIPNATVIKIEKGGFFPHVSNVDELYNHFHTFIAKFTSETPL